MGDDLRAEGLIAVRVQSMTLWLLVLALLLGAVLRSGSVCMVAATEAFLRKRDPSRALLIAEGTCWALVALTLIGAYPLGVRFSESMLLGLAGAFVFGMGAAVNGACAFGVIAQVGTGRFEYALTGVGVWIAVQASGGMRPVTESMDMAPVGTWSAAVMLAVALVLVRLWLRRGRTVGRVLFLGLAMAVGAACFTAIAVNHARFPWIALLNDPGMATALSWWIAGSVVAGAIGAGLVIPDGFNLSWPGFGRLGRRLIGGVLMGTGSVMLPGGNSSLLFFGLTTGAPMAALGLVAMVAGIVVMILASAGPLSPFLRRVAAMCGLGHSDHRG